MPIPQPRFVEFPALLIAGLRDRLSSSDTNAIPEQWQRLAPYLGRIPGQVGRTAYGICFQNGPGIDYLCGVEVSADATLPSGFSSIRIPAQQYAIYVHEEHVSQLRETICRIWNEWLPASGAQHARTAEGGVAFFERYGERFDPVRGTGDIEVWIPILDKGQR